MLLNTCWNYFKLIVIFPARNFFILINGIFGNYHSAIWLLSDGRSGSTWVSSILNNNGKALQVFEPFHPAVISKQSFTPYTYSRQLADSSELVSFYKKVFAGKLLHRRANFDNRRFKYSGIVVKDVFASLSSHAIYQHFKNVSVIILIRNPFDVIISKETTRQKGWSWPTDLKIYTHDSQILKILNKDQIALLRNIEIRGSDYEKHMVNWVMCYFVMLNTFKVNERYLLFYEKIKENPTKEFESIKDFLGPSSLFYGSKYRPEVINATSRTLRTSNKAESWKNKISATFNETELKTMKELLYCFDLTELYGANGSNCNL